MSPRAVPNADLAPTDSEVTDYDRDRLTVYVRLLDAAAADAPWQDAARIVLGIDPGEEPERARRMYDSHLARARWMTEHGYRDLLRKP